MTSILSTTSFKVTAAALLVTPAAFAFATYTRRTLSMAPSVAAAREANSSFFANLKADKPVAVFVGGTSGIGQGLAETFAKHRAGRAMHLVIVGRNEQAAKDIIANLTPKSEEQWTHEFVKCDVTLMREVHNASSKILASHPKINYLILSPGYFSTSGRDETEEGLDKKLAVHYYGRWKFIDELLPALRKAKEDGEDARVMSVFSAGMGGKVDLEDLGLKKTYSVTKAALSATSYNDLMIESFSERNPGIAFAHAYPGGVQTNLMSAARSKWIRALAGPANLLMKPFMVTPQECGEYLWSGLLKSEGSVRLDNHGEDMGLKGRYFGNDEARKALWEHTVEVTKTNA